MLVNVEAFLLHTLAHTQAMEFLDAEEEQEAGRSRPQVDDKNTQALYAEKVPATPVEDATVHSQQARQERAEDTADTMDAGSADRIINMQLAVDELNGENQHDAANQADNDRAEWGNEIAACRDTDQSREDAVEGQGERGFSVLDPGQEHRRHSPGRSRKVGGQKDMGNRRAVHRTSPSRG